MTGVHPVIGPLSEPVRGLELGPYRCGCNASYGQSCPTCDGSATDEWEIERAARDAQRDREKAMRNPAYRARWLDTFEPGPIRDLMAADAEERYGPIPHIDETRRTA